jgi:hypothetical protein
MSATKAQQLIQQKEQEIEEIRRHAFEQDIVDVLSNKKHTEAELYAVTSAFDANYERKMRQTNLVKAREAKKDKSVTPAQ